MNDNDPFTIEPDADRDKIERQLRELRQLAEQVRRTAQNAADEAANRIANEREGAPIVTIGLDTPVDSIPAYSSDPDYEPEPVRTVRDVIIERAAHLLIQSVGGDKLISQLRDEVRTAVRADVDAKVGEIVTETLTKGIVKTNNWGDPVGDPTSLKQMVIDSAEKWMRNRRTDSDNRRGYGTEPTGAEALIRAQVEDVMGKELSAEIVAAKAEVKKRVQLSATDVMTKAITDGLGAISR